MPDRYAVKMMDWRGHQWDFTGDWVAGITSGGVDGLVGTMADVTAEPLGQTGQIVVSQRAVPASGTVTFHCRADESRTVEQVMGDFRRAFSPSVRRRNELTVTSPLGPLTTLVRLNGPIPPPVEDPSSSELVMNVQVPLITDDGVWWKPVVSGKGTVTVSNDGDVPVWVRIRWSGAGGVVTLPSGATFLLPAVKSTRVLSLSRQDSLVVRDAVGQVDHKTWQLVRGVFPEFVPVGATRRFKVPTGAQVEYQLGVLEPWQ